MNSLARRLVRLPGVVIAVLLAARPTEADYVALERYFGQSCIGEPSPWSLIGLYGGGGTGSCTRTSSATSMKAVCTGGGGYNISEYQESDNCAGVFATRSYSERCQSSYPTTSELISCVRGQWTPPLASLQLLTYGGGYPGGSSCGSLQPNTLLIANVLPVGSCFLFSTVFGIVTCTDTSAILQVFNDADCLIQNASGTLVELGCSTSPSGLVTQSTCITSSPSAAAAVPGPSAAVIGGAVGGSLVAFLLGASLRIVCICRKAPNAEASKLLPS